MISTHNTQQSSSPFITVNCVKPRAGSPARAKIHKVFVMPDLRLAIYHLHFSKHTPTNHPPTTPSTGEVPYTLRAKSRSKGGIVEVRDSQNLLASPHALSELSSNLNSDKAGITTDSRIAGSCGGGRRRGGRGRKRRRFSEINAKIST